MKKIELAKDVPLMGVGITIPKGTSFKVEDFNSRFVYVRWKNNQLRLSRKDVVVKY